MSSVLKTMKVFVSIVDEDTDEPIGPSFLNYQESYDQSGNLLEEVEYDQDGEILNRATYTFNEANDIVENARYLEGDLLNERVRISRDENGKIVSAEVEYGDGSRSKKSYAYANEDRDITIEVFEEDGTLELVEFRKFNEKDQLLFEEVKSGEGDIEGKREMDYDADFNLIEAKIFGMDAELADWQQMEYNDQKQEVKRKILTPNGEVKAGLIKEYDEAGNLQHSKLVDKSGMGFERFYKVDGEEEWEEHYDGNGLLNQYIYRKRNSEGNLVFEDSSKAGKSGLMLPVENDKNFFRSTYEYEYWD